MQYARTAACLKKGLTRINHYDNINILVCITDPVGCFLTPSVHQQTDKLPDIRLATKRHELLAETGMEHEVNENGRGDRHHGDLDGKFLRGPDAPWRFNIFLPAVPNPSIRLATSADTSASLTNSGDQMSMIYS